MAENAQGFTVAANNALSILPAAVEFQTSQTGFIIPALRDAWVEQFQTKGLNSPPAAGLAWYNPDGTTIQYSTGAGVQNVSTSIA